MLVIKLKLLNEKIGASTKGHVVVRAMIIIQ